MSDNAESTRKSRKKWFPLESNPDVMNRYIDKLGFETNQYAFVDVLSTEEWALAMVPGPVLAVLMLFPVKDSSEAHRKEESDQIKEHGQVVSPNVYYMKQTVGNACGTVGLLHAIGNASNKVPDAVRKDSFLSHFLIRTQGQSADKVAEILEEDSELEETHKAAAAEGQSEAPALHEDVNTHFVCFTEVDGNIYELDGRKNFPINHGKTSRETFLFDAAKIIQHFMARDPDEVRFTITALAPVTDDFSD